MDSRFNKWLIDDDEDKDDDDEDKEEEVIAIMDASFYSFLLNAFFLRHILFF